jgi:hypothetical protein
VARVGERKNAYSFGGETEGEDPTGVNRRIRLKRILKKQDGRAWSYSPHSVGLLWTSDQRRADHSSRGVLPSVVCLNVIVKPRKWGGLGPLGAVAPWRKKMGWEKLTC